MARKHKKKIIRIKKSIMALLTCQSLPSYIKIPSKLVQILKKEKQQQVRGSSYKEYNSFFQFKSKIPLSKKQELLFPIMLPLYHND